MKQALFIASALALAVTAAPAAAKPGNGHGPHATPNGYGAGGCPPGLAKKQNGCMPPGHAKKLYNAGQRFRPGYGGLDPYGYNQIPYDLRNQYGFDRQDNYYYGNGYLYQVDPKTHIIQQVISALLH